MKHNFSDIEMKTFHLINQTRMNPQTFVKELSHLATIFKGKTYQIPGTHVNIVTQEGRSAVDDAVKFLKVNSLYQAPAGLFFSSESSRFFGPPENVTLARWSDFLGSTNFEKFFYKQKYFRKK